MIPTENTTKTKQGTQIQDLTESKLNDIKVNGLAKRIFKSPLFWVLALTTGIIAFVVVALTAPMSIPLIATISVIAVGVLGVSTITISNWKRILYEISLSYSIIRNKLDKNWRWYDEIIPGEINKGSVTLGALPLKSKNHHIELKDYAFLSMVQEDEMRWTTILSDPLTPEDRETMSSNNHKHIPTQDFNPVSVQDLKSGVEWIIEKTNKGINVYLHCKAGRARSGAVIVCYILQKKKIDLTNDMKTDIDNAIKYVQEKRPQTDIGSSKRKEIEAFYQEYCIL